LLVNDEDYKSRYNSHLKEITLLEDIVLLATLTAQDFQGYLNKECKISIGDETLILVLTEAKENPHAAIPDAEEGMRIPFSLIFKGHLDKTLESSANCTFYHQQLGEINNILITRIASSGLSKEPVAWYQIIFS